MTQNINLDKLSSNHETLLDKNFPLKMQIKSEGQNVVKLQRILKQEELYEGQITGYFDEKTKKAVETFQKKKEIEVSGIVDFQTWNRIFIKDVKSELSEKIEYSTQAIRWGNGYKTKDNETNLEIIKEWFINHKNRKFSLQHINGTVQDIYGNWEIANSEEEIPIFELEEEIKRLNIDIDKFFLSAIASLCSIEKRDDISAIDLDPVYNFVIVHADYLSKGNEKTSFIREIPRKFRLKLEP